MLPASSVEGNGNITRRHRKAAAGGAEPSVSCEFEYICAENAKLQEALAISQAELRQMKERCAQFEADAKEQEAAAMELYTALAEFLGHQEGCENSVHARPLHGPPLPSSSSMFPLAKHVADEEGRSSPSLRDRMMNNYAGTQFMNRDPIGDLSHMVARLAQERHKRRAAAQSEEAPTATPAHSPPLRPPLASLPVPASAVSASLAAMHLHVGRPGKAELAQRPSQADACDRDAMACGGGASVAWGGGASVAINSQGAPSSDAVPRSTFSLAPAVRQQQQLQPGVSACAPRSKASAGTPLQVGRSRAAGMSLDIAEQCLMHGAHDGLTVAGTTHMSAGGTAAAASEVAGMRPMGTEGGAWLDASGASDADGQVTTRRGAARRSVAAQVSSFEQAFRAGKSSVRGLRSGGVSLQDGGFLSKHR